MSKRIGIIAEDSSDVAVIGEILSKYMNKNEFSISKFIGNGCGKLRNKCTSWANQLFKFGCDHVLVFHDLDRNNEADLRKELEEKLNESRVKCSLVVIPIEELEAWLLSDPAAIKKVFGLTKEPKKINDCEGIASPKEHLRDLIWKSAKKRYLNTSHNHKIAKEATLENFRQCKSFLMLDKYVTEKICA